MRKSKKARDVYLRAAKSLDASGRDDSINAGRFALLQIGGQYHYLMCEFYPHGHGVGQNGGCRGIGVLSLLFMAAMVTP